MKRLLLLLSAVAIVTAGCAQKPAANTATATPKPSTSPAASTAKTTKKLPESKVNPVPADWITMADEVRGYEFMVPKGSNSGVYLMGQYEVQVFDSFGNKNPGKGDCGAVYGKKEPSENASKAPGEWQSFDIVFQAPR